MRKVMVVQFHQLCYIGRHINVVKAYILWQTYSDNNTVVAEVNILHLNNIEFIKVICEHDKKQKRFGVRDPLMAGSFSIVNGIPL